MYTSISFLKCVLSCDHHHSQDFTTPKSFLLPPLQSIFTLYSIPWQTILFHIPECHVIGILQYFFLLHLASFTSEIHFMSCVSALHSFYCQATLHCMNLSHFLHSPIHRHVGCFQFLLIMNHLYIGHDAFIYLGKHLRKRITRPYGKCMFKKLPSSFLKYSYQQCHFVSLPTMRVPITLHPPSSWYGLLKHFSHSNRSVVTGISHLLVTNVKYLFMCL